MLVLNALVATSLLIATSVVKAEHLRLRCVGMDVHQRLPSRPPKNYWKTAGRRLPSLPSLDLLNASATTRSLTQITLTHSVALSMTRWKFQLMPNFSTFASFPPSSPVLGARLIPEFWPLTLPRHFQVFLDWSTRSENRWKVTNLGSNPSQPTLTLHVVLISFLHTFCRFFQGMRSSRILAMMSDSSICNKETLPSRIVLTT